MRDLALFIIAFGLPLTAASVLDLGPPTADTIIIGSLIIVATFLICLKLDALVRALDRR